MSATCRQIGGTRVNLVTPNYRVINPKLKGSAVPFIKFIAQFFISVKSPNESMLRFTILVGDVLLFKYRFGLPTGKATANANFYLPLWVCIHVTPFRYLLRL